MLYQHSNVRSGMLPRSFPRITFWCRTVFNFSFSPHQPILDHRITPKWQKQVLVYYRIEEGITDGDINEKNIVSFDLWSKSWHCHFYNIAFPWTLVLVPGKFSQMLKTNGKRCICVLVCVILLCQFLYFFVKNRPTNEHNSVFVLLL